MNPLQPFIDFQGAVILDGALATELENRGYDIDDPLWSAKILLEAPEAIRQVHLDYLQAGADVLITASYQASFPGFAARGLSPAEATSLLERAIDLALEARDTFWADPANRQGRLKPLVAASIGPYGAYLANGAEYTGAYDLDEEGLYRWHRPRWEILAGSKADLLACETIPSFPETRALLNLLRETPGLSGWFSFTGRDGRHISDGTPLSRLADLLDSEPQVAGIGINCTPPQLIPELIEALTAATTKPLIIYPNSGESYDAATNSWSGVAFAEAYGTAAREWRKLGATCIGGCCRTTPAHIRAIADRLRRPKQ